MSRFSLENYERLKKIGSGTFGEVYKIKDKRNGEIYAAKISSRSFDSENGLNLKDFNREVEIISKVYHPGIIKFIGMSRTNFSGDNKPVIVTKYMENSSLDNILSLEHDLTPPPEWDDTIKLINIYGIAATMSYLHSNNIIHRDLKPANILLDKFLFPVLADFGLSKDQNTESSTVDIKGTPLYIAPEIWEEERYSPLSDVYAFGFLVYELFAKEKPFKNLTIYKVQKLVCSGKRPPTDDIPEPYCKLVKKCWKQAAADRCTFDQIVEQLKSPSFITSTIDKNKFISYMNYIDNCPKSYEKPIKVPEYDEFHKKAEVVTLKKYSLFTTNELTKLSPKCTKIIKDAEEYPDWQFRLGCYLIKGLQGFEQNIDKGVQYLKKGIKGGNLDAVIYYNRLLIEGKIIKEDLFEAKKTLKKYAFFNSPDITCLQGIIEIKLENYDEAVSLLKRSIAEGNEEAMFEYGKLLYLGENIRGDKQKAKEYFDLAKENGYDKGDQFIKELNEKEPKKSKKKSKFTKKVDIAFLIDGTVTNSYFFESFKETFYDISNSCLTNYPNIYFRFGAIIYRDLIVSQKSGKDPEYPFIIELTDDLDVFQENIDSYEIVGGGPNRQNDWGCGYLALLTKLNWNKDSIRTVIQICDLPAYGKFCTLPYSLAKKYIKIPRFKNKHPNRNIYNDIQTRQGNFLYALVTNLANTNTMFFCLNGNQFALHSFSKVSKLFISKGGKKFVVKDLFGYSFQHDDDPENQDKIMPLNDEIIDFFKNVVDICTSDDLDEEKDFEIECKDEFERDLKKFYKVINYHPNRSANTTDNEDDDDLSLTSTDDEDEENVDFNKMIKTPKKRGFLPRHQISRCILDDDDNDTDKKISRTPIRKNSSKGKLHYSGHHDDDRRSKKRPKND